MSPSPELLKLQQSVRESRASISREYMGLLSDLDFKKRFTESLREHPLRWMGGAATAGLLATLFGGVRAGSQKKAMNSAAVTTVGQGPTALTKAGWLAGALELGKFLYPILRPVVVEFVSNAAQAGLAKRRRNQ
jgi:Na+-transporting methylmalonyl-CoA/oxaloacetate decarboxylase beta subunit